MARLALLDAPERPAEDVGVATYESLRESDRRLVLTILVAAAVALVLGGAGAVAWARLHMPHAAVFSDAWRGPAPGCFGR